MAGLNDKNLPVKAESELPDRPFAPPGPWDRGSYNRAYPGEDDESSAGGFSLRDILYVLFRHKWKILLTFLGLAAATILFIALMPPSYESEARIFIRGDRTGLAVDPTGGEGKDSFLKGDREGIRARTEIGIMSSTTLAEKVVDQLGPEAILGISDSPVKPNQDRGLLWRPVRWARSVYKQTFDKLHLSEPKLTKRQMAIGAITSSLTIAPTMSESMVLKVTLCSYSPEMAQKILNALVDAYVQQHIEIHKSQVSPEFFRGKIKELKTQLAAKENDLERERKRLKVSSLDNQKTLLLSQFNTFDTNLKENNAQINATKARIQIMERYLGTSSKSDSVTRKERRINPFAEQIQSRLLELKLKEADLTTRFLPNAPELKDVRNQITELQKMLLGQKSNDAFDVTLGDPANRDLELQVQIARAELEAENAREATLTKEVTKLRGEIDTLIANEKQLRVLERDTDLLENEYRQYLKSLQVTDISSALDRDKVSNVSVVQRATMPVTTVKSQRKLLALMGFGIFMALVVAVGWAFLLEYCNHSIKTNDDVEKNLRLPVLITLPYSRHHKPELREEAG